MLGKQQLGTTYEVYILKETVALSLYKSSERIKSERLELHDLEGRQDSTKSETCKHPTGRIHLNLVQSISNLQTLVLIQFGLYFDLSSEKIKFYYLNFCI